jgi:hypothetical protein
MDRMQPTGHEALDQVEVWDPDATQPVKPRMIGARRRLTVSVPGAIAGGFLVCALAFGSSLGTGRSETPAAGAAGPAAPAGPAAATARSADGALLGDGGASGGAALSIAAQTEQGATIPGTEPGTEPGSEPGATPGTAPDPGAEPAALGLDVSLREHDVKLAWTTCDVDGFVAYKIIRSTDAGAGYPRGEGDTLVGGSEDASRIHFVDEKAPAGKRLWYAVFGLASADGGIYVACASEVESIVTPAAPATTPEPTPKPDPTEKPAPSEPTLGLTLVIDEGHPYLDWTACEVDGAQAYKVVRSTDNTVRWPLGEHDTLVKVVGMDGKTAFFDTEAPAGKRLWYRVFCVRHVGDGYQVLSASATKSVETPSEPAPEPQALSLEIASEGGNAILHWEVCTADPFSHYRIVRTAFEGTTVVKEIEDRATVTWTDETVVVGETYHYTVQCKGHVGSSYPLLGTSGSVAVTIE